MKYIKEYEEVVTDKSDIIITIPSNIDWNEYRKELDSVKNGSNNLNFKVPFLPKKDIVGNKCYLNYNGNVVGWMKITGIKEKSFTCSTTGKNWSGKFIERSGQFNEIEPIPMKGFRGFRYFNLNELNK